MAISIIMMMIASGNQASCALTRVASDGDDGNVGGYSDKHCADRLSFNLEFHPMVGLTLVILTNMLRR